MKYSNTNVCACVCVCVLFFPNSSVLLHLCVASVVLRWVEISTVSEEIFLFLQKNTKQSRKAGEREKPNKQNKRTKKQKKVNIVKMFRIVFS